MSYSSVRSILDMPDEILVMIILHFDARQRLALGNSCQRFNDLVFGDKELLRNLDFTEMGQLTKESDIQQYFNDENTYKKILSIDTERVRAVSSLSSSIGKAINLVELNVLGGLRFESIEELSCFLKPLVHLKRLSINWPGSTMKAGCDNPNLNQVLEEPFSRLTYLSLEIESQTNEFPFILQPCQRLEELRMIIHKEALGWESSLRKEHMKLSSLKVIRFKGDADPGQLRRHVMCIVLDPAEWTDFHLPAPYNQLHLERNIEVCEELSQIKEMPRPQYVANYRGTDLTDKGWPLVLEHLLSEVIRITHEDAPKKFCCLDSSGYACSQRCVLDIEEAKKLLKDPGYQITYLELPHVIHKNCDVHLLASAFPNLNTLILSQISNKNLPEKTKPLHRRLRRKGSPASKEDNYANTDSSFKMLVENTPRIQVLELLPDYQDDDDEKYWDGDALSLISGWKNLTNIRFWDVPITDGKFLIDIGKECEKLETIMLYDLSPDDDCCYESELFQMLQHCKNLKTFSLLKTVPRYTSEMFNILSNCSKLEDLHLETVSEKCDPLELMSSVRKMLRQCQQLKQFSIEACPEQFYEGLRLAVERITNESNRSFLRFFCKSSFD